MRGVRRQIVEHLTRAHREVPAVTYVEECDFSNVDLAQLLPTVLRATALSLQEFPELNARLEDDEIVYLDRYDLGIAVQTEQGLVVPVVRGCAERSLDELREDIDDLAERARAGKLDAAELRGSTFTVTSAGKLARAFRDAARQSSRGRAFSAFIASARARSCAKARSSCAPWGTSASRSITGSSTARGRRSSPSR